MSDSLSAGKQTFRSRVVRTLASVVLAAGVFSASAPASADFLKFSGYENGSQVVNVTSPALNGNTNAGGFKGFFAATEAALASSPLLSYCIELAQNVSFNVLYDNYFKVALSSAPNTIAGGMGATKAGHLAVLLGDGRFTDSFTSTAKTVAMQLAIWEIVYETTTDIASYDVTKDTFRTGATATTAIANQYLAALSTGTAAALAALTSSTNQDFITVVPVPPSAALLGTGLLFGLWTMRRRRNQA